MVGLVVVMAQVGAAQLKPVDSAYSTDALRRVVEAAALVHRAAPAALNAYKAHLETEIGFLVVDTLGRERTGQVEQLGSTATWSRDSGYDAHVIGYRTQSAGGFPMSMVGLLKSWTLPMLYGERLAVGVEFNIDSNSMAAKQGNRLATLRAVSSLAVHPFAADRDQYYRYAGGDTVAVLTTSARRIPLMRIRVTPRLAPDSPFAAFDGEVDIDADRFEIVRMRGQYVVNKPPRRTLIERLVIAGTGTTTVAYVEYVNAEYDGRYWLPVTQRFEAQARIAMLGGIRPVLRIVSHFSDFAIDDTTEAAGETALAAYSHRGVTFAPSDSMSAYDGWLAPLGTTSSSVAADDFDDIAPPAWKGDGAPRLTMYPSRPDRVVHYNRVEGLYTGAELSLEMRGAAPGVIGRVHGGWAWPEQTARGGLSLTRADKTSRSEIQIDRSLATTGGFENDRQGGGSSLGAFFGSVENADYVDRWNASVSHMAVVNSLDHGFVTGRVGLARDVDVPASLLHGPILTSVLFRPNHHAATGTYGLGAVDYEIHPNVSGDFLEPGVGSTLHVDVAAGQLSWVRTLATVSARGYLGPITLSARLRGGAIFSAAPPPQTLFEVGGGGGLGGGGNSGGGGVIGYMNNQFAGDRAATLRSYALYGFPIYRAPHRVWRFLIPGLSPGIAGGIDAGWTGISNNAARQAVLALGDTAITNGLSQGTGRIRTTASIGLTFFAHAISFGIARPIDQPAPWRWVLGVW